MPLRAALAAVCVFILAGSAAARPDVNKLLLGINGPPVRFQQQTGQKSAIKHVFLAWQQGMAWGTKLDVFLPQLAPIPMLSLQTGGGPRAPRRAVITPQQIAQGGGDAYLVYLNKAINGFGSLVYVRPMAEMNNPNQLYNPSKGAGSSPAWYRKMFARIYLVLHGGPRVKIDVALKRLGLPYLTVQEDLPDNSNAKLRVIWSPVAGMGGWMPFYPGKKYVDLVGNDIYGEGGDFSGGANEELYAFARAQKKWYSFPEWGVSVDQPEFVRYLCDFIRAKPAIELAAYFNSIAGSRWDLGPKPKSKQAYRSCLTPLELAGGPPPPPLPPPTGSSTGDVLVNGKPFTGGTIPYGSRADVTDGTLTLSTGTGTMTVSGAGVSAKFVLQRRTDNGTPILQLRLRGGDFSVCPKSKRKSSSVAKAPPQQRVRRLYGKSSGSRGRVRIAGKYAAGTDQGTVWLTTDRCDGTLTQVRRGTVSVRDLVTRKTVVVRAGHSYLAKKP